jgi:excisionase family DNA binding protein
MTNRTSRSQPSEITIIGRRRRPLTKLRTIEETAELLSVSPKTVRRLINSGALQVHRFGRAVRIDDADIADLLAATRSI